MIFALLLAAAPPQTVLEADRALAAAVQAEGQWTAFRRFAAPDAVIFYDGPHPARPTLAAQRDPPSAMTWTVAESWTSCDGTTAFTVGPVKRPGGKEGTLLLVWQKQRDGRWKWVAWKGAAESRTEVPGPRIAMASCAGTAPAYMTASPPGRTGRLWSPDRTLMWDWHSDPSNNVTYTVRAWDGKRHVTLIAGGDQLRFRKP